MHTKLCRSLCTFTSLSKNESYRNRVWSLVEALKQCILSRNLHKGKLLHAYIIKSGEETNIYIATTLINMYAKCGSMSSSHNIFDSMDCHNMVVWNSVILGYVENGEAKIALEMFELIQRDERCVADGRTFVAVLKACTALVAKEPENKDQLQYSNGQNQKNSLKRGARVHSIIQQSRGYDVFVASALVTMYTKCGSLDNAVKVFERMPCHNAVAWNALMLGYVENGRAQVTLEVFHSMRGRNDTFPDALSYLMVLKALTSLLMEDVLDKVEVLKRCVVIHAEAAERGFSADLYVASALVNLYAKQGRVLDAEKAFHHTKHRDTVLWNTMMTAYVENGEGKQALELFARITTLEECRPNVLTFVTALKACVILEPKVLCLEKCGEIHFEATKFGFDSDMFLRSTLVDTYAKLGMLNEARNVFNTVSSPDVVAWTSMILAYAANGEPEQALHLFQRMKSEGCETDAQSFLSVLRACTELAELEEGTKVDGKMMKMESLLKGRQVHEELMGKGFDRDLIVANSLVDLYAKCGSMTDARRAFDNITSRTVISWTSLILGYAENGEAELALETFERMRECGSCKPNSWTFAAALKACGVAAARGGSTKTDMLNKGRSLHLAAADLGFESDVFLINTLVDMYVKCGSMDEARKVFEETKHRDVMTYTILVLGYAEYGKMDLVLEVFNQMKNELCEPDSVAYVALLKACAGLAEKENAAEVDGRLIKVESLDKGMGIHLEAVKDKDIHVMNTLVDMYATCGSMLDARKIFDTMEAHLTSTWNALLLGYVENGESNVTLELFQRMPVEKDTRTHSAALKACGILSCMHFIREIHAGVCRCSYEADSVLLTSLVEAYGKCGSMYKAQHVVESCSSPGFAVWSALTGGYSREANVEETLSCFHRMVEETSKVDGQAFMYVLTAYSHAGLVEQGKNFFRWMQDRYGWEPSVEHYVCMVDMLGRANEVELAVQMVKDMPFEDNSAMWTAILGSCVKWRNVEVGKIAFENITRISPNDAGAYTLMANLYVYHTQEQKSRRMTTAIAGSSSGLGGLLGAPVMSAQYGGHPTRTMDFGSLPINLICCLPYIL